MTKQPTPKLYPEGRFDVTIASLEPRSTKHGGCYIVRFAESAFPLMTLGRLDYLPMWQAFTGSTTTEAPLDPYWLIG